MATAIQNIELYKFYYTKLQIILGKEKIKKAQHKSSYIATYIQIILLETTSHAMQNYKLYYNYSRLHYVSFFEMYYKHFAKI